MSAAFILSGGALLLSCLALYHAVQARHATRALLDATLAIQRHTAAAARFTQRFSGATFDGPQTYPSPAQEVQAAGQGGAANG